MTDQERITSLEVEVVELRIASEVNKRDIKEVRDSVKDIKSNTNKIVWLVGSALIVYILNAILKGGIHI